MSNDLAPTAHLRWIERTAPSNEQPRGLPPGVVQMTTVRVLQQWWIAPHLSHLLYMGEWRDVPVVTEAQIQAASDAHDRPPERLLQR